MLVTTSIVAPRRPLASLYRRGSPDPFPRLAIRKVPLRKVPLRFIAV